MSKKMLFIYNPMAGKEQIKNKLSEIIQIFCKEGFEVTIFATRGREDATKIIEKKGERYDYIVCSGGDGTMNEVATGLMKLEKRPICGYIPAGTVNDFASSLKIPRVMKNAASLIADGDVFNCDMGKFNDRYFTYVAGFGAFTEVSYQTPQEWKNALGKAAYFIEALKHIADIKPHHMKIEYDGGVIEDEFILGLISNSVSVAGYKYYEKKNIKMAVASSTRYERVLSNLKSIKVDHYFDAIIGGDQIQHGKPAPDIFLKAVELLGVSKEDALVLEDSKNGILAAHAGNIPVICIPDLIHHSKDILDLTVGCYDSLDQLIDVIVKKDDKA